MLNDNQNTQTVNYHVGDIVQFSDPLTGNGELFDYWSLGRIAAIRDNNYLIHKIGDLNSESNWRSRGPDLMRQESRSSTIGRLWSLIGYRKVSQWGRTAGREGDFMAIYQETYKNDATQDRPSLNQAKFWWRVGVRRWLAENKFTVGDYRLVSDMPKNADLMTIDYELESLASDYNLPEIPAMAFIIFEKDKNGDVVDIDTVFVSYDDSVPWLDAELECVFTVGS